MFVPAWSVVVVRVATPLLFSGKSPRLVEPSIKLTVPAGVLLEPDGDTVAVIVMDWPALDGFSDEMTVVVLGVEFGKVVVFSNTPTLPGAG